MTQSNTPPFDPFGAWTAMRDAYMEALGKQMIDLVNSEEYARATGAFLDGYLAVSQPFRQSVEKAMAQVLAGLNIPTRQDVVSLAERLTNIEMRLDDLDARLDTMGSNASPPGGQGRE